MDAIVLFSHGSVLCGSGVALDAHAQRLRESGIAPIVEVGYLNYSEPAFGDTVARCVLAGATRILVAPYFLVPGYFVDTALPKAVAAAQEQFPALTFAVAKAIGFDEMLADVLITSAQSARPSALWGEDLQRASQFCRPNPQCPLFGTPACPKQPLPPVQEAV